MADDNDVTFEIDPNEAFQRLCEQFLVLEQRQVKLEAEHEGLKGLFNQVLDTIEQKGKRIDATLAEMHRVIQKTAARATKPPTRGKAYDA